MQKPPRPPPSLSHFSHLVPVWKECPRRFPPARRVSPHSRSEVQADLTFLNSALPGGEQEMCVTSLLLSRQTTKPPPHPDSTPFQTQCLQRKELWEAPLKFSLPHSPQGKQNVSSSRLVARPGPHSQLPRQEDTICSSSSIRQLAASFLPNFLGTCVASGKALYLPEFLVAVSV